MGALIKFILIVVLVFWLFGKVIKFFLKIFLSQQIQKMANQQQASQQPKYPEGSIHVETNTSSAKDKKPKDTLGGDYVDYEVIK
ncbi:MAG: hypothetical protein RL308_3467 [Bacteroidota bacterium]|jgi:hypothetical protein